MLTAASGEEALDRLRDSPIRLALLDLLLGGRIDGLRVLEAVRWRWPEAVVILITAHGTLDSAVSAIQEGADGYLLKPVQAADVRNAVEAAFRRRAALVAAGSAPARPKVVRGGPFELDLEKSRCLRSGQPIDLTPREFRLLAAFLRNAQRVLPPLEVVEEALGYASDSTQEARDLAKWYVHRLRRKVETDPSHPRYILNVRGVGWRFTP